MTSSTGSKSGEGVSTSRGDGRPGRSAGGPPSDDASPGPSVAELSALRSELSRRDDIENRLRAEVENLLAMRRTMEQSEPGFEQLYDRMPLPSLTTNGGGLIQRANTAAAELFGTTPSALVGKAMRSLVVLDDRREFLRHVSASRHSEGVSTCDLRMLAGAGEIPMQLRSRPVSGGDATRIFTLLDMTERDRALEEQRRLLQSAAEAREAATARDQFIAMLSHELRTPLTPVLAAVSALLRRGDVPSHLRKLFSMIARNVEAESRLIDDLLDTTRIAHRKMRIDRAPVDVHAVLHETLDLVLPEVQRKKLTVVTELGASTRWISADAGRLRQVFWNLLQNALKFTSAGGRIDVRSWNRGDILAIEVADSGVGIAPEMIGSLFSPFQQAPDPSAPSRAGLGLGLAICRGIVQLHDGEINVTSPGLGKGSRFVVDFPTIAEPVMAPLAPTPSRPHVVPPAPSASKPRILLVEDDPDTADTLADLLAEEGFEVTVAHSVAEALKQDVRSIDLVLSDLGLGDGSGLDLMRALRCRRDVQGIALSGYGTESDIRASKDAGFRAHLIKPVSLEKLVAAIKEVRFASGGDDVPTAGLS